VLKAIDLGIFIRKRSQSLPERFVSDDRQAACLDKSIQGARRKINVAPPDQVRQSKVNCIGLLSDLVVNSIEKRLNTVIGSLPVSQLRINPAQIGCQLGDNRRQYSCLLIVLVGALPPSLNRKSQQNTDNNGCTFCNQLRPIDFDETFQDFGV
jgi:hypothetical protein